MKFKDLHGSQICEECKPPAPPECHHKFVRMGDMDNCPLCHPKYPPIPAAPKADNWNSQDDRKHPNLDLSNSRTPDQIKSEISKAEVRMPNEWWVLREEYTNRALMRDGSEKWPDDVKGEPSDKWLRVIEHSAYLALQSKLSLAEQDRDSWKQSFSIQQDAANKHIVTLEAELAQVKAYLDIAQACYLHSDDNYYWAPEAFAEFKEAKHQLTAANERAWGLVAALEQIKLRAQQYQKCNPSVGAMATEALLKYKGECG